MAQADNSSQSAFILEDLIQATLPRWVGDRLDAKAALELSSELVTCGYEARRLRDDIMSAVMEQGVLTSGRNPFEWPGVAGHIENLRQKRKIVDKLLALLRAGPAKRDPILGALANPKTRREYSRALIIKPWEPDLLRTLPKYRDELDRRVAAAEAYEDEMRRRYTPGSQKSRPVGVEDAKEQPSSKLTLIMTCALLVRAVNVLKKTKKTSGSGGYHKKTAAFLNALGLRRLGANSKKKKLRSQSKWVRVIEGKFDRDDVAKLYERWLGSIEDLVARGE